MLTVRVKVRWMQTDLSLETWGSIDWLELFSQFHFSSLLFSSRGNVLSLWRAITIISEIPSVFFPFHQSTPCPPVVSFERDSNLIGNKRPTSLIRLVQWKLTRTKAPVCSWHLCQGKAYVCQEKKEAMLQSSHMEGRKRSQKSIWSLQIHNEPWSPAI